MKTKTQTHTPGPWKIEEGKSIQAQFEGEDVQLCLVNTTRWSQPDNGKNLRLAVQSEANARLIAAAPDLLAVCKAVALGLRGARIIKIPPAEDFIDMLRAAIAKAEGQEAR